MYICPICGKKYLTEKEIKKHSNACWKKENPHYRSKKSIQKDTIITKNINKDMLDFFKSFKEGVENDS